MTIRIHGALSLDERTILSSAIQRFCKDVFYRREELGPLHFDHCPNGPLLTITVGIPRERLTDERQTYAHDRIALFVQNGLERQARVRLNPVDDEDECQ